MKLTILGTGNATVTECYNTCFALSDGNRHFLVDTGGGNRILKVLKDTGIQLEDILDISFRRLYNHQFFIGFHIRCDRTCSHM